MFVEWVVEKFDLFLFEPAVVLFPFDKKEEEGEELVSVLF